MPRRDASKYHHARIDWEHEQEWVWNEIEEYVKRGELSEEEADALSFESAVEWITNYSSEAKLRREKK